MKKSLDIRLFSHSKRSKVEKKALNNEIYNIFLWILIRIHETKFIWNIKECVQHISNVNIWRMKIRIITPELNKSKKLKLRIDHSLHKKTLV